MSETVSYIGLAVSIIGSIGGLLFTIIRTQKEDMKQLEHRMTSLEDTRFTLDDRKCLHETQIKVELFWGVVEREFPKLLKQVHTPKFDKLLSKVDKTGTSSLTVSEAQEFSSELKKAYEEAVKDEDASRAMALALYMATVNYRALDDANACR